MRRGDPAAFRELDVDPGDDALERIEVLREDTGLVGDDRDRRALLQPGEVAIGTRRERLLDELHPELRQLRQQRERVVTCPAGVRVDPDRPVVHVADRPERREVGRATALDLEGREVGGAPRPLRDDRWLVETEREVGRREVSRETAQRVDLNASGPADEVVERDIDRTARGAVPADGRRHRPRGGVDRCDIEVRLADRLQQQWHDRRHRLGRLAVEAIGVALPQPDDVRQPIVAQLDDDGGDPRAGPVVGARDPEWVPKRERQDLVPDAQTHGNASTASRMADQRPSAPKRTMSSVGSPVSFRIAATSARASSSLA